MASPPPPKDSRLKIPCFRPGTHRSHGRALAPTRAVTPEPAARCRARGTQRGELSRGHRALCSTPSQAGTARLRRRGGDKERAGSTTQTRLSSPGPPPSTPEQAQADTSLCSDPLHAQTTDSKKILAHFSLPSRKCHGAPRHKQKGQCAEFFSHFDHITHWTPPALAAAGAALGGNTQE